MLTEKGYERRTLEKILNDIIARAKELFGDDINTEENTPLGKFIRIYAYDLYNAEELSEQVYYSIFPQYAMGQTLDRLGWSVGMTRNVAIPSQYIVRVTGTAGTTVERSFLVSTDTGLEFYNLNKAVIGTDGTCEIIVECVEAGVIGNISASNINRIVNPHALIDAVEGVAVVQSGEAEESDYDFRKRYELVREGKGSCTAASIISALTNIPTVDGAYLIVNESATDTVDDIPPKSIACYVDGGKDYKQEIAEAIFDKKPVGIGTTGDQTVMLSYGGLADYAVHFYYSKNVDIYVNVEITTNTEYGGDGNGKIRSNISEFIDNLGIGKPLITTTLYSQIYSVSGVVSASVTVSTNGMEYSMDNISVKPFECCTLKELKINGVVV